MVRIIKDEDINWVNTLLLDFDYKLKFDNNPFQKVLVYPNKGVLVYSNIYGRIEIDYLIVDERFRNQGIATELLNSLYNKESFINITLEVRESNQIAIKFYEKHGFKKIAIRENYYSYENAILMIKEGEVSER